MLLNVQQVRQIEQVALISLPLGTLMQRAANAAALKVQQLISSHPTPENAPILVIAGPGNNGGDALRTAYLLALNAEHDYSIDVHYFAPQSPPSAETQLVLNDIQNLSAQSVAKITWLTSAVQYKTQYACVIDGLFGIGIKAQTLSAEMQNCIYHVNNLSCPILALDVPSGLDINTGQIVTNVAIHATHTITFIADKIGLHTLDGVDLAGQIEVARLELDVTALINDIQSHADNPVFAQIAALNQPTLFAPIFAKRAANTHKGSFGNVAIIGGAQGMQGAVVLASRAALLCGAGKVYAGFVDNEPAYDPIQPEIMCRNAAEINFDANTIVAIGTGLGRQSASAALLKSALTTSNPLIIDADALNIIADDLSLQQLCKNRKAATLITPHPLEAARLMAMDVKSIQADRINAAQKLAQPFNAVVILKGAGSVIAHPAGQIVVNATGNPGLASGGTGDVLTGICAALVAQHHNIWQAALAACYLHGAAADNLVQLGIGPIGLCASELGVEVRHLLNRAM